jgi:hypothetical protein
MPRQWIHIKGLDLASTAFSSPTVNSVPTRLPSRPSRAILTASPIRDSRTSGSYSVTWQRMLSNIHQILSLRGKMPSTTRTRFWMKGSPRRFRRSTTSLRTIVRSARVRESNAVEFPAFLAATSFEAVPRAPHRSLGGRAFEIQQAVAWCNPTLGAAT